MRMEGLTDRLQKETQKYYDEEEQEDSSVHPSLDRHGRLADLRRAKTSARGCCAKYST